MAEQTTLSNLGQAMGMGTAATVGDKIAP